MEKLMFDLEDDKNTRKERFLGIFKQYQDHEKI